MNPAQRLVLVLTAAVFFIVAAIPPWIQQSSVSSLERDYAQRKWAFVFDPPDPSQYRDTAYIDWTILVYEFGAVAVASVILLAAFRSRPVRDDAKGPVP